VRTFAAGSDIHARQVPPAFDDSFTTYRPGALAPEMPSVLVGKKCDRQERARLFADRAVAVADKARNLIALEAEEVFWRWAETRKRAAETYDSARAGLSLQGLKVEDRAEQVQNWVLAAQGQGNYNEALYQHLITLAALERVTAGGFCAGLGGAPVTPDSPPLPLPQP